VPSLLPSGSRHEDKLAAAAAVVVCCLAIEENLLLPLTSRKTWSCYSRRTSSPCRFCRQNNLGEPAVSSSVYPCFSRSHTMSLGPSPCFAGELHLAGNGRHLHQDGRTQIRWTSHASNGANRAAMQPCDALPGINLLVSLMTSSSTSCFIVAVFLYKNKSRNTIEIRIILSCPFLDQWPRLEHTPFTGIFSKEPLSLFKIEPAVQNMFTDFVFIIWKRILFRLSLKYVFTYLQICHWFCFSHNFSVLTPIWSVQITLGS